MRLRGPLDGCARVVARLLLHDFSGEGLFGFVAWVKVTVSGLDSQCLMS
jgi:hypothetical protein